jgi:acyl-CoA thioester hydrolase
MHLNYKKPARYDDLLIVKTTFKSYSTVKIEFDCELWNENNELLTTAQFILVFINIKTGKPMVPPQYILDIMNS